MESYCNIYFGIKQEELADVEDVTLAQKRKMENTLKEKEQEIFHKIAKVGV